MEAAHPHDLTTFADHQGLALRGGHHCNQPLMRKFGLPGTTRASFYFYNTMEEIDRMIEILPSGDSFLFMNRELEELYQEIILDHSRRPRNFGELAEAAVRVHGDNPACGDEIHLGVQFGEDGSVKEIKFTGHGCAISQASASMMTAKLKGKSREEAMRLLGGFKDLVTGTATQPIQGLGDLQLMEGVRKFPQRVKCAMLPWRAVEQAFRQTKGESRISTETDSTDD